MNKPVCFVLGMLAGVGVVAGTEAVLLLAVPSKTIVNNFGATILGEKPGSAGIIPMLANMQSYTVDDFPIIKDSLNTLLAEGGMGDLITINYEQIKDANLLDGTLSVKLKNAIKVTATISSLNVSLGQFGNLTMFKEWTAVSPSEDEIASHPAIYYYEVSTGKYDRAYDDNGVPVVGYADGSQLYLADLSRVVVTELFANLSVRIQDLTYKEFMISLMGQTEQQLQNDQIYKLIGDRTIKELGSLDTSGFKLLDIVSESSENAVLFDILEDLTGSSRAEITLGQLSSVNIENAKLTRLLNVEDNAKLFSILEDMTGLTKDQITIANLENVNVESIKISTVLSSDADNVILRSLINKNTTIGGIGGAISSLNLNELFGEDVFTADESKKANSDIYYLEENDYVYSDSPQAGKEAHYISVDAGVWLLFAYDAKDISNANGRAGRFSPSTVTFSDLQNDASRFSDIISEARVYQLISANVIQDKPYQDYVKALSLNQALALIG